MTTTTASTVESAVACATILADLMTDSDAPGTTTSYLAADRSTRAAVRSSVADRLRESIMAGDLEAGQTWLAVEKMISEAKVTKARAEVDVTALHADKINSLRYALATALADASDVSEVDSDRLAEEVVIDFDSMTAEVQARGAKINRDFKISTAKAPARDLGAALRDLADRVPAGTFLTVAQVCDQAGLGSGSGGAVAARLFPTSGNCTLDFVTPVERVGTTPRGAIFNA